MPIAESATLALDFAVTDLANALRTIDALVPALDESHLRSVRNDLDDLSEVFVKVAEKVTCSLPRPDLWAVPDLSRIR